MKTLHGYLHYNVGPNRWSIDLASTEKVECIWVDFANRAQENAVWEYLNKLVSIRVTDESVADADGIASVTTIDAPDWIE